MSLGSFGGPCQIFNVYTESPLLVKLDRLEVLLSGDLLRNLALGKKIICRGAGQPLLYYQLEVSRPDEWQ